MKESITMTEIRATSTWSVKDDSPRGFKTVSSSEIKPGDKVVYNNYFVLVVNDVEPKQKQQKKETTPERTQKELKTEYRQELAKAWESERMINYCAKEAAYIIEHDGALYEIDKPRIKTSFCFGHGYCGITTEEDENRANAMARHAAESAEYFKNENMKDIDRWIETLTDIAEQMRLNWAEGSHPAYMIETGAHYTGQTSDCRLKYFSVVNTFNDFIRGSLCEDIELIEKLIKGYEEVKKDFDKRLNTYLKRYSLTKVRTWSYLSD